MNVHFIGLMSLFVFKEDYTIPNSQTAFWQYIQKELSKNAEWQEIELPRIGKIKRELLEKLIQEDFLVRVSELPHVAEASIENIRLARAKGMTPLHLAALEGNLDWVEEAVTIYPVDQICNSGQTALTDAAEKGFNSIVHLLLVNGAQPQKSSENFKGPLELAAEAGHLKIVRLLIEFGAEDNDQRAFKKAIQNGHEKVVIYLTKIQKKVDFLLEDSESAINQAIMEGDRELVEFLIDNGVSINLRWKDKTPLQMAILMGNVEIVNLLIERGADVNAPDELGKSPLYYAASLGNCFILKILIKRKELNFLAAEKLTGALPVHAAVLANHEPAVRLLVEKFKELYPDAIGLLARPNNKSETALHLIMYSEKENTKLFSFILENVQHINVQQNLEQTALHLAILNNKNKFACLLLEKGANPLLGDQHEVSSFHYAVANSNTEMIQLMEQSWYVEENLLVDDEGNSLLFYAYQEEVTAFLIDRGYDVNQSNNFGNTPLHLAIFNGHFTIARLLVERGADPSLTNQWDETPIHLALAKAECEDLLILMVEKCDISQILENKKNSIIHQVALNGHLRLMKILLAKRLDVNQLNEEGDTALNVAISNNHLAMVKLLLKCGANPNYLNNQGLNSLHLAILFKREQILINLIQYGGDLQVVDQNGYSLLQQAVWMNHLSCVKALVEHNFIDHNWVGLKLAIIEKREPIICYLIEQQYAVKLNKGGQPALVSAARMGLENIVEFLLQQGMDSNVTDEKQRTALHYAAKRGNVNILETLLNFRADPSICDEKGWMPIHHAVCQQHEEIVRQLIDLTPDLNAGKGTAASLIHIAALNPNENIFNLLVEEGCDLSLVDDQGCLPLHYAVERGYKKHVDIILSKHPEQINAVTSLGFTPLSIAIKRGHENLVRFLLEKGASREVKNKQGVSIYHYACQTGNKNILELVASPLAYFDRDKNGFLPIHYACMSDNLALVSLLLKYNSVNAETSYSITPLLIAVREGYEKIVTLLLEAGADYTHQDHLGRNALLLAASQGKEKLCILLEKAGCNSLIIDNEGLSFFHHLAYGGVISLSKELLERGQDVNQLTVIQGDSALHLAALAGQREMIDFLLSKGISLAYKNRAGRHALFAAVKANQVETMQQLQAYGLDLFEADLDGHTCLHVAIIYGAVDAANYILRQRPEEKERPNVKTGNKPIHYAALKNQVELIELLIKYKVDLLAYNFEGEMAIHLAAGLGHKETVQLFLKKNVSPDALDSQRSSALMFAASKGHTDIIHTLIQAKANVNLIDQNRHTPLYVATLTKQAKIIPLLLQMGAQVNLGDTQGWKPIHLSSCYSKSATVLNLLDYDMSQLNLRTNQGSTPLHLAIEAKNCDLVKKLLTKQADPNLTDKKGNTALHLAAGVGSKEILQLLLKEPNQLNKRNKKGQVPLHYAAFAGHTAVAELILNYKPSQLNKIDFQGHTPLGMAMIGNHTEITEFFLERKAKTFKGVNVNHLTALEVAILQRNETLNALLVKKHPDEIARIKEYFLRKGLWHCSDYPMKERGVLISPTSKMQEFRYAGTTSDYFISEITQALSSFSQLFPELLEPEKLSEVSEGFVSKQLIDQHKKGCPIFIKTGFKGHNVITMVWKEWFCICNRGAESRGKVEVYRFDAKKMSAAIIKKIQKLSSKKTHYYLQYLYKTLPNELGFQQENLEKILEKRFNQLLVQIRPVCAWTSTETSMAAFFVFNSLFKNSMQVESIKFGMHCYRTWYTFMQEQALHKYVQHTLQSEYEPDIDLVENSLALLRTQQLDNRIRSLLLCAEEEWNKKKATFSSLKKILTPSLIDTLWVGSQQASQGSSPVEKVKGVYKILKAQCLEGIHFNKTKIKSVLKGETSMAMSLDLAANYLQKSQQLEIGNVEAYRDCIRSFRSQYERSNRLMRVRQKAFNTIEVIPGVENVDYALNKVQSLANFHTLKVDYASLEFDISTITKLDFSSLVNKLTTGVYLIRMIQPSTNKRLEKAGSSFIYIKEEETIGFFYDSHLGVKDLYGKDHADLLRGFLLENFYAYQVHQIRFYKLQPEYT